MLIRRHTLLERGDTIVEVLIAVAIVSLVLASAYTISNQSTRRIQDTQEHSRALQLVQQQIEFLRSNDGIDSGSDCFDSAGVATTGAACTIGTTPAYALNIQQSATDGTYQIQAKWESILNSNAQITMYYRL